MKTSTKPTHTPGMYCKFGVLGAPCFKCKYLLAAAPELLEASKKLIAYMEQVGYQDDEGTGLDMRLRQAIAKAEGR